MNKENKKRMRFMEELRLPELQARFHDIVGEPTRSPNKKFLLRRIAEALEVENADTPPVEAPPKAAKKRCAAKSAEAPAQETGTEEEQDERLSRLSIEELQARYLGTVGRPTGSANAGYLKWKIRQAEKGRITVGPVQRRQGDGPPPDFKVLPLRMEADLVTRLDEARERLGLVSRMELFRRSLQLYLDREGETEVAALFGVEA